MIYIHIISKDCRRVVVTCKKQTASLQRENNTKYNSKPTWDRSKPMSSGGL